MATENTLIANSANATGAGGFMSGLSGLLSKAADVYVELQGQKNLKPAVGTNPTQTQTNPNAGGGELSKQFDWKPVIIGGGIFVGAIVVFAIVAKAVK